METRGGSGFGLFKTGLDVNLRQGTMQPSLHEFSAFIRYNELAVAPRMYNGLE